MRRLRTSWTYPAHCAGAPHPTHLAAFAAPVRSTPDQVQGRLSPRGEVQAIVLRSWANACARQQVQCVIERQPDNIAVGAVDQPHESFRAALDGVAAGLADTLAAGEVSGDLGGLQPL